jgi:hypothetical protein
LYAPAAIAELLRRTNIGGDIRLGDLRLPYDVFCVVLERDFEIEPGTVLRAVKITALKSRLAKACLKELFKEAMYEKFGVRDFEMPGFVKQFEDCVTLEFDVVGPNGQPQILQFSVWLSETIGCFLARAKREREFMAKLVNFSAAILLRNHCRPETVVPFKIPRSERFKHKGNRESFRILTYPWKKSVREGPTEEQRETLEKLDQEERRKVKAHVRGFVYRTLRDERFRRNQDGTPRIIEVEPCIIHPEELDLGA